MRIATVSERLNVWTNGGWLDVEQASGQFSADPQDIYPRWDEFREWGAHFSGEHFSGVERKMLSRPASPIIEGLRLALVEQLSQHGLDVAAVADMVLAAIDERRVHILTNPEFVPLFKQRVDGIIGEARPQSLDLDEMVRLAETTDR